MTDLNNILAIFKDLEAQAPSGFALGLHMRMTSPEYLIQTYPKDWIDLYSQKGYVISDPTVAWGLTHTGTIRWSDLVDQDSENILEQSKGHGMAFGVTIAFESEGTRSLCGFSRPDREYYEAEIQKLWDDIKHLHRLTAATAEMNEKLREDLRSLSIQMTRSS